MDSENKQTHFYYSSNLKWLPEATEDNPDQLLVQILPAAQDFVIHPVVSSWLCHQVYQIVNPFSTAAYQPSW